jgi:hypothetical protein
MSDLTNKDAEQDSKLAVLESRVESFRERVISLEERMKEVPQMSELDSFVSRIEKQNDDLKNRVRQLERWVWGAAAVIAVGAFVIGIAANAQEVKDDFNSLHTATSFPLNGRNDGSGKQNINQ